MGWNSEWTQPNGSSVAPWTRASSTAEIFPSAVSVSSQSVQRVGFPQPLKVFQGSAGRGHEARAREKGQTARRAGDMERHGGGDAVEVGCVPYGGAEVVHEHPEPLVLRGGGVEGGDREPALMGHP
ncbi:hypothetical protein [Streptomyces sp. PpalLS-921]|uniref:hypothetical protein n=1 Tax=unclassified Streptomyces TaxID=2593676 RepID=UPI00114D2DE1|nr:hypothetical protein [Streptomyces sp. PpalLS-921]